MGEEQSKERNQEGKKHMQQASKMQKFLLLRKQIARLIATKEGEKARNQFAGKQAS